MTEHSVLNEYGVIDHDAIDDAVETLTHLKAPNDSFYLSYPWLKRQEGVLAPQQKYLFVLEGNSKQALAGCPVYFTEGEATYYFYNLRRLLLSDRAIATVAQRLAPSDLETLQAVTADLSIRIGEELARAAIVTAPYGYTCALWLSHGAASTHSAVVTAVEGAANAMGSSTSAFMYVPEGADPNLDRALVANGYDQIVLDDEAFLTMTWDSFDGYLASVSSDRRWAIRRELRAFEESGLTITFEAADALTPELAELGATTSERYGHKVDREKIRIGFERARSLLAPYMHVLVVRSGERPVAYLVLHQWHDQLYAKAFGIDPVAAPPSTYCYFNLLFYAPIRLALELEIEQINFGPGGIKARVGRGCELRRLNAYIKFRPEMVTGSVRSRLDQVIDLTNRARKEPGAGVVFEKRVM